MAQTFLSVLFSSSFRRPLVAQTFLSVLFQWTGMLQPVLAPFSLAFLRRGKYPLTKPFELGTGYWPGIPVTFFAGRENPR